MHTQVNGYLRYEGVLKLYWGLKKSIQLAPGVMYAKARNSRDSIYDFVSVDDAAYVMMLEEAQKVCVCAMCGDDVLACISSNVFFIICDYNKQLF